MLFRVETSTKKDFVFSTMENYTDIHVQLMTQKKLTINMMDLIFQKRHCLIIKQFVDLQYTIVEYSKERMMVE